MPFDPRKRLRRLALGGLLLGLALLACTTHAASRGRDAARRAEVARATVHLTGLPDLALSSTSRWLRHPSQAEPAAAFADLPGALDVDPAGALIAPPTAVLAASSRDARREGDR